jgi:hypothetical protein
MTPLLDPTPQQLAARLDAGTGVSGRAWGEEIAFFAARAAGVAAVFSGERPMGCGVCWWTDRLGRRHWAFPADLDVSQAWQPAGIGRICLHPNRHPLEWVAPPLSCGWRERGGRREFVVACHCGVVGTPESIGWMGQTCGPCFDRQQEGVPSLGQPVRRLDAEGLHQVEVTRKGWLIASSDHPHPGSVHAWQPPWTGEPAWTQSWFSGWDLLISPDGSRYVLVAGNNYLVGNAATGEMQPRIGMVPLLRAKLAGPSGNRLVGAVRWDEPPPPLADCYQVAVHRVGQEVGFPLLDLTGEELRFSETVPTLAVSPDGRRIFADRGDEVRAWDAGWLNCTDRMRLSRGGTVSALVPLADGSVIAAGETAGSSARAPDAIVPLAGPLDRLRATPDSQGVCGLRDGSLIFHDAHTLREVAAFRPADALNDGFAFAPDGLLVAGTSRGLAAWPWRELFAVE